MYVDDQPDFLNAVVILATPLGPIALLRALKAIEAEAGRQHRERFGPREIDLDVLAYGALQLAAQVGRNHRFVVPHPRNAERDFVLEPAFEIAPDFLFPGSGTVRALREKLLPGRPIPQIVGRLTLV
jgi:2-amino-4-hydroxy-6-hydroxymethyldihydropteridine diphosphokinase